MVEELIKTWEYEEQTKAKHFVFADYIDKWIMIVGKYNKLNYIDGFGGIGAYHNEKGEIYYGSPILAAKAIEKNTSELQRSVQLIIIDEDNNNLENINKIFRKEKLSIKPIFIHDNFDNAINEILDKVKNLAPTFVFIDPFGFKIKMKTIEKIMQIEKSEILLNFMFTRINQFLGDPKLADVYNELFGGDYWKNCIKLQGEKREICIVEGYREMLKKFSKYVYYFKLEFPKKQKTYYYLFHLTNHFLGCSIIKSSFAKFNFGRVEYRGIRGAQLEFSDSESIIIKSAIDHLCKTYNGKQKTFQEIIEDQIDETLFLESHLRKAIKTMDNKQLTINRIPSKTKLGKNRVGLEYQDIVAFK